MPSIGFARLPTTVRLFHRCLLELPAVACNTESGTVEPSDSNVSRYRLLPLRKKRADGHAVFHFVDHKSVRTVAGNGGNGMVSFLHLWRNARAGPSGGDGGNGAHVIFVASQCVRSLSHLPAVIRAPDGENGRGKSQFGANAEHVYIEVPIGTIFNNLDTGDQFELDTDGQMFVAAHGGAGGHGNQFYVTSTWQNPMIAEAGGRGENVHYEVELRMMAYAGLIGFPNVGKSSLLRCLSRARPKVGAYTFTTLKPHVGMLHYGDGIQVPVADLPGILPGAHRNHGLGLQFLRHVKRCFCLLYVLDIAGERPLAEQLSCLEEELRYYDEALLQRPRMVVVNKVDLKEHDAPIRDLTHVGDSKLVLPISALHHRGIDVLAARLRQLIDANFSG